MDVVRAGVEVDDLTQQSGTACVLLLQHLPASRPASQVHIPILWLGREPAGNQQGTSREPAGVRPSRFRGPYSL